MRSNRLVIVVGCVLALSAFPLWAEEPSRSLPETFTGIVLDAGGAIPRATSAHFTIHIDEYTTEEEALGFLKLLAEEGPEKVADAMWKIEKGWIRIGPSLGYPLSFARSIETEDGRLIRIVTDRPIQFFEVMRGLRSKDHPFGVAEIRLDADGKGEGRLIAAAEIDFNEEGALEIESLGTQPFRLTKVKLEQPKKKKKKK